MNSTRTWPLLTALTPVVTSNMTISQSAPKGVVNSGTTRAAAETAAGATLFWAKEQVMQFFLQRKQSKSKVPLESGASYCLFQRPPKYSHVHKGQGVASTLGSFSAEVEQVLKIKLYSRPPHHAYNADMQITKINIRIFTELALQDLLPKRCLNTVVYPPLSPFAFQDLLKLYWGLFHV